MGMRILLTQRTVWAPCWGGASKSNQLLMAALATRGHECRAVVPAFGVQGSASEEDLILQLRHRNIDVDEYGDDTWRFKDKAVVVTAVIRPNKFCEFVVKEIEESNPDLVIVSSEDPGQVLLSTLLRAQQKCVVYLARTTLALPFGPATPFPNITRTELLRRVTGVVAVSDYVSEYIREWGKIEAEALPISPPESGPFPDYGNFDRGFVTIINPCAYKGLAIFLELARAFPQIPFAAVPTWGTTSADHNELSGVSNVHILPPSDNMENIFRLTRILLVPSLWAEARCRVITEAMLYGIPVMASNVGGIPEAMAGLDYVLPITPITEFREHLDEQMLPKAVTPEQQIDPWVNALRTLTTDRSEYERLSSASRRTATEAAGRWSIQPFERYLESIRLVRPSTFS